MGMASLAWSGLGGEVMAVLDIDAEVLGGYRALNPGVPANRAYVLSAEAVGWLRHPAAVLGVSLHCQPFSTLPREEQKGSGWWDARSWGFHEVCHGLLKLAEECRPKCGYSENLVTWTYALHLEALDALLSVLRACGYEVAVLCTTSEAHGDGQTRWRSYVVFFQCGSGALQRFLGDPPRVRAPILLGGPKGVLAASKPLAAAMRPRHCTWTPRGCTATYGGSGDAASSRWWPMTTTGCRLALCHPTATSGTCLGGCMWTPTTLGRGSTPCTWTKSA